MPRLGFEPTIPVIERAKTFHVLDRAATVIGMLEFKLVNLQTAALVISQYFHTTRGELNSNFVFRFIEDCKSVCVNS
jgi:hypothetical protein